ncbi:MAG: flagellar biosynthetic protein FliQ [Deltaproteobacteria bacterium]|nr:flagellar biosynthetic protein FliQ [Deltaproteobacteria bacterium]
MPPEVHDVLLQSLRALYIVGLPLLLIVTVSGLLASAIQAAFGFQEAAVGFAVKLISLIVVLYMIVPAAAESVVAVAQLAFR